MKKQFIGRKIELQKLEKLHKRPSASLAVIRGRRRIGKSRLVTEFAKKHQLIKITGLAPEKGITPLTQRENFANKIQQQLGIAKPASNDWENLFIYLAQNTAKKNIIILLDEISWMAAGDASFLPKLKNTWDDYFQQNNKLTLILCGSISSWIDKNILCSTGYFGRVSETITLKELSLTESLELLETRGFTGSALEKFMVLSLTGGVPWYLEMFDSNTCAKQQIHSLCFEPEGLLTTEFNRIFHDLFGRRSPLYQKIIEQISMNKLNNTQIANKLSYSNSGALTEYLEDLAISGFIEKEHNWSFKTGHTGKIAHYRVKDNYLRFYLRFIAPNLPKIERGMFSAYLEQQLPQFDTIMGLQFENLILNNRKLIWEELGISLSDIVYDNPFIQKSTKAHNGCQIDYLIQTKYNGLFICEIKFSRKPISSKVITEVKEKINHLIKPKNFSCFPVLIHIGEVTENLEQAEYFSKIINMQSRINTE